jgi:hypothetical protein
VNNLKILHKYASNEEIAQLFAPCGPLDKLLFEELKMESGKWKVNVSTAWIYLKYIAEGDTTTVNFQFSFFHCAASNFNLSISWLS